MVQKAQQKARPPAKKAGKPVRRQQSDGRLDPQYAANLLAKSGGNPNDQDAEAFLKHPRSTDALAENLGEGFLQGALAGEDDDRRYLDPDNPEEDGGPFVETSAGDEFAYDTDESNPEDAEPAPFPTTQSNS